MDHMIKQTNMSDTLKGITNIWMRLFDHKSFLNGEIQFVLREFEQKRNDQEVEKLFSIIENITNIKDTQINKVKNTIDQTFPQLNIDLSEALYQCKGIEDIEKKYKEDISLEIHRENRKVEWETFVDSVTSNCSKIDDVCNKQEEDLHKFYQDLESKLFVTKI